MQGRKLCSELVVLFANALKNVSGDFMLFRRCFLGRLDEIRFPVFGAHLDLLRSRNPPLDVPAPIAPAIRRADVFNSPILVRATFIRLVHDSRSIPSEPVSEVQSVAHFSRKRKPGACFPGLENRVLLSSAGDS